MSLLLTPSAASTLNFRPARWMMAAMLTLILTGLLRGVRTQHALVLENLALRHQLAVLQRTAPRPRLRPSDRLFWVLSLRFLSIPAAPERENGWLAVGRSPFTLSRLETSST